MRDDNINHSKFSFDLQMPGLLLRVCKECNKYTLQQTCPVCGHATESAHPARFSPQDPYSQYRIAKKQEKGLLPTQQPDIPM